MNYFRYCQDAKIANTWFDIDSVWLDLCGDFDVWEERFNDFFG